MSVDQQPQARKTWPDYRAVWRWHFYASLFCIPFVIILSISGGVYLFKPQIEAWNERQFDHLIIDQPATAAAQIRAALASVPGSTFNAYELPRDEHSAVRVIVRDQGALIRVYVHPQTLQVLHSFPESDRFMRLLFRLHGELLMGDRGSMLVELAASWAVIMIITGLYLWWPRQLRGLGGILYPRLRGGSRMFWRDLHSVTGVWISGMALFLLLSGLPWAKSWGNYLKAARQLTGTASAKQDWSNTSRSKATESGAGSEEHAGHRRGSGGKRSSSDNAPPPDLTAVDRIVATVRPLELAHPVVIAPPARAPKQWTVKSMTPNRPYRVNLVVDATSGEIVSRDGFEQRHWIDKLVAVGIAAHEGQLFGWPNQLLGLLTALGLILLSISGVILWWRRRDQGVLGAPKVLLQPRISFSLLAFVAVIGIYLPLFGTSLILVLITEWLILRRIPGVRTWLGLQPAALNSK